MSGAERVVVVGGGLAGLAAALALESRGLKVELLEARRCLGGRASSFCDPHTGEWIDFCQHVSMGCCTNLADFCLRAGLVEYFQRVRRLHFLGPDGRRHDVRAARWLPAPFHLAPSLMQLSFLSLRERWQIGSALLRLARMAREDPQLQWTTAQWLNQQGQSPRCIRRFWDVVLTSALGDSIERISVSASRKVMIDGFLAHRAAYEVFIPKLPLGALYGDRLRNHLQQAGVRVRLGTAVRRIEHGPSPQGGMTLHSVAGEEILCDYVVLAVTWRRAIQLLSPRLRALPQLSLGSESLVPSPITGIHLWADRPIDPRPHLVLVERLSQWLFARGPCHVPGLGSELGYYYQVVVSASHEFVGCPSAEVVQRIWQELQEALPDAAVARLLHARVVTEKMAVFSPGPGSDARRPLQRTEEPHLALAGDWTQTGWPSTMEGAVRSGYLAAEAILEAAGRPNRLLVPDLPRGWLVRWLIGRSGSAE